MSLFGTGRAEGVAAVLLVFALTALAHVAAAWAHELPLVEPVWMTAAAGAVGGACTYRFLRAQGRSRYAGFVGGLAYGMSPLFAGLSTAPREQLAAALAPLALEAVQHVARTTPRRRWMPWIGATLALPFAFGVTVIALLTAALALGMLALTVVRCGRGEERVPRLPLLATLALGALAAVDLAWLDALAPWLGPRTAPTVTSVLGTSVSPLVVVRTVGPFLIWFALFGLLRRQRQVNTAGWLLMAVVGIAPTFAVALPPVERVVPDGLVAWAVPAMAWWCSVLALTVMGTAGLDDWLDQPQRRRGAHLLLLIVTVFLAPALAVADRDTELVALAVATVLGTFALLVATSWTWKRLGVLRFKKVLVAVALLAFAAPVTLTPREPDFAPGASPLGEGAVPPPWPEVWRQLQEHPSWHFAGVAVTLLAAGIWALASRLRRR